MTPPNAPPTLPQYIADWLPKQDDGTLRDTRQFIDLEYRTCGDETCHCMSGGGKHGPYKYRASRDGNSVRREYLGKADAE